MIFNEPSHEECEKNGLGIHPPPYPVQLIRLHFREINFYMSAEESVTATVFMPQMILFCLKERFQRLCFEMLLASPVNSATHSLRETS
ncbi:hypothetical protein CDAR_15571 [Caerostris darwini]|uniref:Uncharacterized protein n=1 Tax=Caerostris darwini TaxID=1538125 RepID=A0AAV4MAI5_9ARAC|nr:hypothetical protein CDAR_15571 [Caerostris darwini]